MGTLKVVGNRSLFVYCDCGAEHKLTVNGQGEYKLETKAIKPTGGSRPAAVQATRKRTIFDAPIPGDEEETREDQENEERD